MVHVNCYIQCDSDNQIKLALFQIQIGLLPCAFSKLSSLNSFKDCTKSEPALVCIESIEFLRFKNVFTWSEPTATLMSHSLPKLVLLLEETHVILAEFLLRQASRSLSTEMKMRNNIKSNAFSFRIKFYAKVAKCSC